MTAPLMWNTQIHPTDQFYLNEEKGFELDFGHIFESASLHVKMAGFQALSNPVIRYTHKALKGNACIPPLGA